MLIAFRNYLNKLYNAGLLAIAVLMISASLARAQKVVAITDTTPHHIFTYGEIEYLEDPGKKLTLEQVTSPVVNRQFKPSLIYTPKYYNSKTVYWYRFRVKQKMLSKNHWILEFFDQTINDITLYAPQGMHSYRIYSFGNNYNFAKREFKHKNFTVNLTNNSDSVNTYYVRLTSMQAANVIIVLRDMHKFVEYALYEYFIFGLFYGMIIIFSLYNLLMFIAVKQRQYMYYVLYNLSIGFYEMCSDGIAFQYLWPNHPGWNTYAFGIALFLSSVFGLLFTINFLFLRTKAPLLYQITIGFIAVRIFFFAACLYDNGLFNYKIIEFVPLLFAFYAGCYVLKQGFRPARFFVVGYSFLVVGFLMKILLFFNVSWLPYGPFTYYSLSFCFVIEMTFVSFAIGDSIRHLRKRKDSVQRRIIKQLHLNEQLKDTLNKELTTMVEQRTRELVDNAILINKQNEDLALMNATLTEQAENISRMNVLLEIDNQELHVNIEKVTRARVMSQTVDFNEFSKIYPDKDTCFKYLADLKWPDGFTCRKCANTSYLAGHSPHSRRCTRCRYEESVIANTIFQNSKISINKSFYMLFLIYSTKGGITSQKLSEILDIRQGTCWAYATKMKKVLDERKKDLKNAGEEGWSKLVLE
jgi:hypothetical protein